MATLGKRKIHSAVDLGPGSVLHELDQEEANLLDGVHDFPDDL
jgi:hypothetical protein